MLCLFFKKSVSFQVVEVIMKRFQSVDIETGEIFDYSLIAVKKKQSYLFDGGWIAMGQNAAAQIANNQNLNGTDLRVFLMLLSELDFENFVYLSQVDLAEKMNLKTSNLNVSLKRLIENSIVIEGPRVGRTKTFKLNANLAWKGSAKTHVNAVSSRQKFKKTGFKIVKGGK